MLTRRIYYAMKPVLPWPIRIAMRRWRASRIRNKSKHVWPISNSAGKPPPNWAGWPNGKKFAFVLTHDVEGVTGYNKVGQLAEMERRLGFRSSFNFVPEGEYRVQRALREELERGGFEVGVHDLHHDGKLYNSQSVFRKRAQRINAYLSEWNAVGFRSAFMLHNLDWLGELDLVYDASTFDSDPFEPQPGGVNTIFPFWVPGKKGSGFVELRTTRRCCAISKSDTQASFGRHFPRSWPDGSKSDMSSSLLLLTQTSWNEPEGRASTVVLFMKEFCGSAHTLRINE